MTSKKCTRCKEEKLLEDFPKNPKGINGLYSQCRACKTEQERARYWKLGEVRRKYDYNKGREQRLRRQYGITLEQYEELREKQNFKCYICQRPESAFKSALHVDHAHTGPRAGVIRGLLCWSCNVQVISKHTDPVIFHRAAEYLEQDTGWFVPEGKVKPKRRRKRRKKI